MPNTKDFPELKIDSFASCGCATKNRTVVWQLVDRGSVKNWRGQCKSCRLFTLDDVNWLPGPDMERILRLKNK